MQAVAKLPSRPASTTSKGSSSGEEGISLSLRGPALRGLMTDSLMTDSMMTDSLMTDSLMTGSRMSDSLMTNSVMTTHHTLGQQRSD